MFSGSGSKLGNNIQRADKILVHKRPHVDLMLCFKHMDLFAEVVILLM